MSLWTALSRVAHLLCSASPSLPERNPPEDEITGEVRQAQQRLHSASSLLSRASQTNIAQSRATQVEIAALLRDNVAARRIGPERATAQEVIRRLESFQNDERKPDDAPLQ